MLIQNVILQFMFGTPAARKFLFFNLFFKYGQNLKITKKKSGENNLLSLYTVIFLSVIEYFTGWKYAWCLMNINFVRIYENISSQNFINLLY